MKAVMVAMLLPVMVVTIIWTSLCDGGQKPVQQDRVLVNVCRDNSGGHIDYAIVNCWEDYSRVVFVDRGFDGTLDEVQTFDENGRRSAVQLDEKWNRRFKEVRHKAGSPTK